MKPIYLFSHKIKFKRFKNVWNKFPSGNIVPIHIDQIIWQMIQDKMIYVYIDETKKDDLLFLPQNCPRERFYY